MLEDYVEELREIRATLRRLAKQDCASATVSSGGGSKSYTAREIDGLKARESELITLIVDIYRYGADGGSFGVSYPIYCGG